MCARLLCHVSAARRPPLATSARASKFGCSWSFFENESQPMHWCHGAVEPSVATLATNLSICNCLTGMMNDLARAMRRWTEKKSCALGRLDGISKVGSLSKHRRNQAYGNWSKTIQQKGFGFMPNCRSRQSVTERQLVLLQDVQGHNWEIQQQADAHTEFFEWSWRSSPHLRMTYCRTMKKVSPVCSSNGLQTVLESRITQPTLWGLPCHSFFDSLHCTMLAEDKRWFVRTDSNSARLGATPKYGNRKFRFTFPKVHLCTQVFLNRSSFCKPCLAHH